MATESKKGAKAPAVDAGREAHDGSLDLAELKDLIAFFNGTRFTELELERGGTRLRVSQATAAPAAAPAIAAPVVTTAAAPAATPTESSLAADGDVRIPPEPAPGKLVTSPIVGTFYRSPSPDKAAYADVGSTVSKGQVICIVEAMKLMNEIESEFGGRVAEILVEDGEPVEFGQPLMRIVT